MSADPHGQGTTGRPHPDDDLDALVRGLGALVGWQSATYAVAGAPGAVRRWYAEDAPAGGAAVPATPLPSEVLDPATWESRRVLRHDGDVPTLTVPVRADGVVTGALVLAGPLLRDPVGPELELLETVARMVGRRVEEEDTPLADAAPGGPGAPTALDGSSVERTMALVDVFAFTVQVIGDELAWRYFGPNSATVFGAPVSSDEALVPLVERHAHPDDLPAVRELEQAARTGQPLEVEIRLLAGDGTERWVSWRTVPRTVDGALHVDGVATDVSSRHSLGRSRRDLEQANEEYARQVDLRRRHALAVRDANDNVLQRIFAAGLRLQILRRKLDDVEAHAASTIAFQLDQAATDLRELILDLNAVIGDLPQPGPLGR